MPTHNIYTPTEEIDANGPLAPFTGCPEPPREREPTECQFSLREMFQVTTGVCVLMALAAPLTADRPGAWIGLVILLPAITFFTWIVDRAVFD